MTCTKNDVSSLLPRLTLKDLQKVVISQGMESLVSSKLSFSFPI